jgi:hypothetical protein
VENLFPKVLSAQVIHALEANPILNTAGLISRHNLQNRGDIGTDLGTKLREVFVRLGPEAILGVEPAHLQAADTASEPMTVLVTVYKWLKHTVLTAINLPD